MTEPGAEGEDWWTTLSKASDEALEIFYSAFNISASAPATSREGASTGWGSVNAEGEGRKQFFFGDPSDYDLSDINGPRSQWALFKNNLKGFVQAIEWTELWLIVLYCFHAILLVAAIATRHNSNAQIVIFVGITGAVYMAERINMLAGAHWAKFSTQNYFDARGVFISTLWSTPLLLIGLVMLFQSLYSASSLLVQVKRKQIRQELRGQNNKPAAGAPAETKKSQ